MQQQKNNTGLETKDSWDPKIIVYWKYFQASYKKRNV